MSPTNWDGTTVDGNLASHIVVVLCEFIPLFTIVFCQVFNVFCASKDILYFIKGKLKNFGLFQQKSTIHFQILGS
jgi:3D (Asp-Asp-Asp) domain-containing protein